VEWVILSLTSAFFLATSDALAKKAVEDQNEYLVAWFRMLFTLPVLLITLLLVPWPKLDEEFYLAFFIAGYYPYVGNETDKGCLYDLGETDEPAHGCALWVFPVQGGKHQKQVPWCESDVCRVCDDRYGRMKTDAVR